MIRKCAVKLTLAVTAFTFLIAGISPANASDCGDAINRYNSALSEVTYTLKRYATCVADSAGKDDCSSEFRRLKNSQDELESAVSEISSYCGD